MFDEEGKNSHGQDYHTTFQLLATHVMMIHGKQPKLRGNRVKPRLVHYPHKYTITRILHIVLTMP